MHARLATKLSVARWAEIVGINPLHVMGVTLPNLVQSQQCDGVIVQHQWQNGGRIGREEIVAAIFRAESNLEELTGYRLAPCWETDERTVVSAPYHPETVAYLGTNIRGYARSLQTRWKRFISGGTRGTTLIATPPIAWTDADLDGYKETGTVTFATTVTDECEIRLFYPDKLADPRFEIRPLLTVDITAGTATVTFRRELTVVEALEEGLTNDSRGVDGQTDANFLTAVDAYRVYNDPESQISFLWEPPYCLCTDTWGATPCVHTGAYETASGYLVARNERLGLVAYSPGEWSAADQAFAQTGWPECIGREPDIARMYYRSGLQDRSGCMSRMTSRMEEIVAIYALSLLEKPPCACNTAMWTNWAADLAFVKGPTELAQYQITKVQLANELGTRRGAIYAYQQIRQSSDGIVGRA